MKSGPQLEKAAPRGSKAVPRGEEIVQAGASGERRLPTGAQVFNLPHKAHLPALYVI
jgi:hypothetical protein